MATYGRTWWGKKWLETFTGIDEDNRLPRGRTYANTGRAYDIKINRNIITAKVQGSNPRPYKVEVVLNLFNDADKATIHMAINDSPTILSALINKKLPEQLFEKLNAHKVKLFPSNWKEIKANCNCPDWAVPCKHIAAVIYLIGAEIDKNPFVVFDIHGCDLLSLVIEFNDGKLQDIQQILHIDDIFRSVIPSKSISLSFDQSVLDTINLSKIPNLFEQIKAILKDDPLFFDKNFRDILYLAYKHWQRYPAGKLDCYLDSNPIISRVKTNKELSEEDIFIKRWGDPSTWESFNLNINPQHRLTEVFNDKGSIFPEQKELAINLVKFLQNIPNSILYRLLPELRFLHMLWQFSNKLMEKSAFIPQILQTKNNENLIRWIPALFDQNIKEIYSKLCSACPPQLIKHNKLYLYPEEQVNIVVALILSALMSSNLPASIEKYNNHDIYGLFFSQQTHKFTDFGNKEIPGVINQWLSNLYLCNRPYKLYLIIEDTDSDFNLELKISLDDTQIPISLEKALKTKNHGLKLSILADLLLITEYIPKFQQSIDQGQFISFNLDDFSPLFLSILPVLKAIGISVILPKSLQKVLKPQLKLNLKSKDKNSSDGKSFLNLETLLDFDWKIAIGDKQLTSAEFKKLIKQSKGLVYIIDQYVLLDENEIQTLLERIDKIPDHLSHADLMQAALAGEFEGANVALDEQLATLFSKFGNYHSVDIPKNLNAQLRPYQERGFHWLVQNIEFGFGSILADDMGLGKTLQVIAAILHIKNQGHLNTHRVLIIAPTGLLSNWKKEIERFAPELNLSIYHGQNRELENQYDILITSYGLARRDKNQLNKMNWFLLVIDEAQNIKNPNTAQTKSIKSIDAKHKIAMSGTPVENRLLEYWSIFDFSNKHYLGTSTQFKNRYASPIEKDRDQDCLERFKKVTSPFILRRLKNDKNIIQDLPSKIENNRYCSLTSEQAALYQEVIDASLKKIEKSEGIERKGLVLKLINSLKQICNHPSQFGKKKAAHIEQSGKMQMLEETLLEIDAVAEKSLIFTQYTEMGNIICQLLEEKFKTTVPFLHGGLPRKARDDLVYDFQNHSQKRILVVSLKAGGTGLNLTAANHVIHYDLWWNPAVEAQATDRAYRIGQKRNVMVHRFLTIGTFEEGIDEIIKSKKELASLTVGDGENWITEMTADQLKDLVSLRMHSKQAV